MTVPGIGLDHVQLAAPPGCEQAARTFFGGLLGLAEIAKPPALAPRGGAWFALGDGRQLHIGVVAREQFAPALKAHPGFRVASAGELTRLAAVLSDDGHPVVWAAVGEIPGLERFHTADPWGNRLEFLAEAGASDDTPADPTQLQRGVMEPTTASARPLPSGETEWVRPSERPSHSEWAL